jgi:hypothetical protein
MFIADPKRKWSKQRRFQCKRLPSGEEISFIKWEYTQKFYVDIPVTLGDKRPSYCTANNRVARFRTGHVFFGIPFNLQTVLQT